MKKPTPVEFSKVLITIVLPVVVMFIIFLMTVSCKVQDPVYVVSGNELHLFYENRRGELIEVPINSDECVGYKKPYHTTSFNNK